MHVCIYEFSGAYSCYGRRRQLCGFSTVSFIAKATCTTLGSIQWSSIFFSTFLWDSTSCIVSKIVDINLVDKNVLESSKHEVFGDFSNWLQKKKKKEKS